MKSRIFKNQLSSNLFYLITFLIGNLIYKNPSAWSHAYIGNSQFGDAEFWWNGAIHLSQGIIENNPGKGFRPGYFLITAPLLEFFNFNFNYIYLLILNIFFLSVTLLFNSLKPFFGALASSVVCFTIALSPYNIEWIATSTTDGTGLILNVIGLSYLFKFLLDYKSLYLFFFALFLFLNHLTRPLMAPFLVFFAIYLIYSKNIKISFLHRIYSLLLIAFCFLLPTQIWKFTQNKLVGESSLSQNDASAFYAASDPKIQDWTPDMFKHIEDSARKRLIRNATDPLTTVELNQEFWIQTIQNYKTHWYYHLQRAKYHLKALLRDDLDQLSLRKKFPFRKLFILLMISLTIALNLSLRNLFIYSIPILIIIFFPENFWILGLFFLNYLFFPQNTNTKKPTNIILLYWLSGSFALWLVGGTSSGGTPHLNATSLSNLGYRLYSQFYFSTNFILYFPWITRLLQINKFKLSTNNLKSKLSSNKLFTKYINFSKYIQIILILICIYIYLFGSLNIVNNYNSRTYQKVENFPNYQTNLQELKSNNIYFNEKDTPSASGIFSQFFWNLNNRSRNLSLFYSQSHMKPIEMHPNSHFLEVSLDRSFNLKHSQGLIIYRNINSTPISKYSNIPNANNYPHILAFIPLSKSTYTFEPNKILEFPLELSVNELLFNKILSINGSYNQNNIFIDPLNSLKTMQIEKSSQKSEIILTFDFSKIIEPFGLNFSSKEKLKILTTDRVEIRNDYGVYNYRIYFNNKLKINNIRLVSATKGKNIELIEASILCKNLLP